jgi:hypothetical protein
LIAPQPPSKNLFLGGYLQVGSKTRKGPFYSQVQYDAVTGFHSVSSLPLDEEVYFRKVVGLKQEVLLNQLGSLSFLLIYAIANYVKLEIFVSNSLVL